MRPMPAPTRHARAALDARDLGESAASGIARGSTTRLAGTIVYAGFTAVTGVLTARALGAADKGTLATLSYLAAAASIAGAAGLGDALVVRWRGSPARIRVGAGAVMRSTALCGSLTALLVVAAAASVLGAHRPPWPALALAAAAVPMLASANNLARLADGASRQALTATAQVTLASVTAAGTFVLVTVAGGGLTAAALAMALGATAANAVYARWLWPWRRGIEGSRERVRIRAGAPFMVAALMRTLWSRFDLLVVYMLAGARDAGIYSVAVTVGEVAMYPSAALAAGMFGSVSRADDDANALHDRVAALARATLVVSGASAVALAIATPVVLPAAFGDEFAGSIVPAIVLIAASIPAGMQLVVARAATARGVPVLGIRALLLGLAVMIGIDAAQGAALSPARAACGALVGSCVAAVVALRGGGDAPALSMRDVVPRGADLAAVMGALRRLRPA
jgi:O-antigen/teichoic acid export membrane protein